MTPQSSTAYEALWQDDEQPILLPDAPRGVLGTLDELLRRPRHVAQRVHEPGAAWLALRLVLGATLCFVLYGAVAGLFTGTEQVLISAVKTPLIVFGSLALCAPSLYVFSALAGAELSLRWFAGVLAGLAGMLGLLLVGLLPIAWLFSASSRSLLFVVLMHTTLWTTALLFGRRFLKLAFGERGGSGGFVAWTLLVLLVSMQVTTQLRPVLTFPKGPMVETGKRFFLEHLGSVVDLENHRVED